MEDSKPIHVWLNWCPKSIWLDMEEKLKKVIMKVLAVLLRMMSAPVEIWKYHGEGGK